MTKEEVIAHYQSVCIAFDKADTLMQMHRAAAEEASSEKVRCLMLKKAWETIYLNQFDEQMPGNCDEGNAEDGKTT